MSKVEEELARVEVNTFLLFLLTLFQLFLLTLLCFGTLAVLAVLRAIKLCLFIDSPSVSIYRMDCQIYYSYTL